MNTDWPHPDFPRQVDLPRMGHLPALTHLFDAKSVWAIKAALGARRPLLVRGDPGTGKSQLARAVAAVLGRILVSEVVTSRTESQDLHWRFDAVARLGTAQAMANVRNMASVFLDDHLYLSPGPLWWVFDWAGADTQRNTAVSKGNRPTPPADWTPAKGCVLLIDEIDKADPDLPNGLLESLGNGEFHVPYLDAPVKCQPDLPPPLVVITTNEERELPAAFVRRCLVLQLFLPADKNELIDFLVARGNAHFGAKLDEPTYKAAAVVLAGEHLAKKEEEGRVAPGQAEYLDLLRAVLDILEKDPKKKASDVLKDVEGFVLDKNPPNCR
jgi:MoxR-like ATPase